MATQATIRELHRRGFDKSKAIPFEKAAWLGCSQCEALAINGIPTHERGCPNKPSVCRECGGYGHVDCAFGTDATRAIRFHAG